MRRSMFLAVAAALLALATSGHASAQTTGVGTDPFSFYYGYYLPHQSYIAAQPRALDTINQVAANRQYTAQTDRSALYDPISPYGGEDETDTFGRSQPKRGGMMTSGMGGAGIQSYGLGEGASNTRGQGPPTYYNRTARYFPSLRVGRGSNANVAAIRSNRPGGGGMPSAPNSGSMGGGMR